MSNSSALRANAFENLKWSQVLALLRVLRDCDLQDERHVERRFREIATNYPQTALFLSEIGLVARENQRIICKRPFPSIETEWNGMVVSQMIGAKNRYRTELFRYLRRFQISSGEVVHHSDSSTRSKESPVRNFLMDLWIIRHRTDGDYHVVDPAHISLYAQARTASTRFTTARLTALSSDREEIGLSAENAVFAWEQERLGQVEAHRVEHISPRNSMAGYDILSATIASSSIEPRYIEVKSVSERSFQFFWTANEVEVASVLGPLYYLYLVPIGQHGEALVSNAKMINDPTSFVLNSDAWIVEPDVRRCRPSVQNLGETVGCQ